MYTVTLAFPVWSRKTLMSLSKEVIIVSNEQDKPIYYDGSNLHKLPKRVPVHDKIVFVPVAQSDLIQFPVFPYEIEK